MINHEQSTVIYVQKVDIMEFTSEQRDMAKRLSYGAKLFQSCYLKDSSFREQFTNNYQALACFLEYYAYARQGAAPAYPIIALKALKNRFDERMSSVTVADAMIIWKNYQEIARNKFGNLGVNPTRNPMSSDNGLLKVIVNNNITNLATHVRSLIQNKQTKQAHNLITDIRGIGTKIASLYLRDIAYFSKLHEEEIEDQRYLQPVDTWIEQTLSIIFGGAKPRSLKKKQEMIVELCHSAGISSIAFNQGAWILGSQVTGDYSTFKQLAKGQNAKEIIQKHIEERRIYVFEAEHWLEHWPE